MMWSSLGGMDFKYLHSFKLVLHLYLQICNFIFQPTFCFWPLAQSQRALTNERWQKNEKSGYFSNANLFKGRSSKHTPGSFPNAAAFYKGLEELENDLDPKQIERLILFLDVIQTQEKFSKVTVKRVIGPTKKVLILWS